MLHIDKYFFPEYKAYMTKECIQQKKRIEKNLFFTYVLEEYKNKINQKGNNPQAYIDILNDIHDIMRDSQQRIESVISSRHDNGYIQNRDQARKSIAGNLFQFLVVYSLIKNIEIGNLANDLIILKTKEHKIIKEHAIIHIGNEAQKPDNDFLIFTKKNNTPILIFSCKTSLRERLGQTYKWKLLMDIAKYCDILKQRYSIVFNSQRDIKTGLVTPNFYNEIMQPQQRGLLSFFDYAYITKPIPLSSDVNLKNFSEIINDINAIF